MKKTILLFALIGLASIASSYAGVPAGIDNKAAAAFHADFKKAKDVRWTESASYIQVQFSLDDRIQYAYYDHDGRFLCVIRHILTTSLPPYLRNEIRRDYPSYWVTELFELNTDQGQAYYIKLENGEGPVMLSSENGSSWSQFKMPASAARQTAAL
jgi:hypothetical protein